MKKITYFRF